LIRGKESAEHGNYHSNHVPKKELPKRIDIDLQYGAELASRLLIVLAGSVPSIAISLKTILMERQLVAILVYPLPCRKTGHELS
jgi:hypothetical protein